MDVGQPIRSVVPTVHGAILQVLAAAPEQRFTGRHLARLIAPRASWSGVRRALLELVSHGLVLREDHPPVALFSFNPDHVAAGAIGELARLRETFVARARTLIDSWDTPASAVTLFGSAARGDGDAHSDIDLLVIRPDDITDDDEVWGLQLADLVDSCRRWTGNDAKVLEYSAAEVHGLVVDQDHLIVRAAAEGVDLGDMGSLRQLIGNVQAVGRMRPAPE